MDIVKDGRLSCALFVSSILHRFKLIKAIHTTVGGTIKDIRDSRWQKIKKPKIGALLIWKPQEIKDRMYWRHDHIGFYVSKNKAISAGGQKYQPISHHWTFGIKNGRPVRKVEQIFWNKKLSPAREHRED